MVPPFRNENRKQAPFTEIVHSRHRPLGPWFTCSLCVHFAASTVGPAVRGCWCGSITAKDSFCFVPVDLFLVCVCSQCVTFSLFVFVSHAKLSFTRTFLFGVYVAASVAFTQRVVIFYFWIFFIFIFSSFSRAFGAFEASEVFAFSFVKRVTRLSTEEFRTSSGAVIRQSIAVTMHSTPVGDN